MFLLSFLFSKSFSVECSDLDPWLLTCPLSESDKPYVITCPSSGYYEIPCQSLVECTGNVTKLIKCYPTEGKRPSVALCLSVVLGFLGADRFYLGYPTIGLFKMFTGGFFGLGWYIDIFLIALRLTKPARGGVYKFESGGNFRIRLPSEIWM